MVERQHGEAGFGAPEGDGTTDRFASLPTLAYGGDYNPEQWPPSVWREDMALMRRAGVNLVSLGVFAWSRLEPRAGVYDFAWLDEILDLLAGNGIGAALATPTASPPPWFSLAHPDALPVRADGTRLTHGSRDTYCVSAPAYREACARIAGALAERYGGHPALRLWHVHNEYGTWCHCAHTEAAFRRWLIDRHGDLAALNEAWTTAHWGQRYSSWEEINAPRATQYLANPAQSLDFRRFTSEEMRAAYREQRAILRRHAPAVPVTTNFVLGDWVPVDHARWSSDVDIVAIDHYPGAAGRTAEEQTAMAADLARSWAGGGKWLLIEQAADLVYADGRALAKEPGRMRRHSLSHIARGSAGAMFFQWRAPRGGSERWHAAMLPHAGPDTRVFEEVAGFGAELPALAETDGSRVHAEVAILADVEADWALSQPGMPSADLSYEAALAQAHRVAGRAGHTVDFAAPGADLSRYKLVLVPSLYLVTDADADNLAAYVEGGGHVLISCFSGVADEHTRVRTGGHPGAFRDLLGIRVTELRPLPLGERVVLDDGRVGTLWTEEVRLAGAEATACYPSGEPAVTRKSAGRGVARYLSTCLDDEGYAAEFTVAVTAAGASPVLPGLPADVEVVRRAGGGRVWLFVLNHAVDERRIGGVRGRDLLSGRAIAGELVLPGGDCAVVRLG
ncbi:beta-galactosidase [Phytomonospora endophytica]|uniref:Beta-galactosidase n=1 Tax=Phytomonospora endophytica TaxID=714109 RepID=A0A841FFJ9_9ACTN|nr:beta-galactosidase [Phytomonospora endophytica]MBB6032342.1 beta-galactosidase [Phytomonospora endophytica]GIG68690.1 beta-galactosidase [Phytomonospora endophytica]